MEQGISYATGFVMSYPMGCTVGYPKDYLIMSWASINHGISLGLSLGLSHELHRALA